MDLKLLLQVLFVFLSPWKVQGQDCPQVDIVNNTFVNQTIQCNDLGTLLFYVYEDCPPGYVMFSFPEDLIPAGDCTDIIFWEGSTFGFSKVGNAEDPSTMTKVCPQFLQEANNASAVYSAYFTFIDVNEFLPEPYGDLGNIQSIYVDENTMGPVLEFTYRDQDYEEASTLTCFYNFVGDAARIFSITSGDVTDDVRAFVLEASEELDFESNSFFSLEAVFTSEDLRGQNSSTTQSFLIFVQDVGDNPPFFTRIVPFADVSEGKADVFVFQVEAQDRDVNINNPISYSIASGNEEGCFRIDNETGEVFTTKEIDREELESTLFVLEIGATEVDDYGVPVQGQNTTYQVTNVNINDVNDNIPTFDSLLYETTMPEFDEINPTTSTIISDIIIFITDMDEGPSGEYSVTANNSNVVLNPSYGSGRTSVSIALKNSPDFDYEEQAANPAITVEITATETANASHASSVLLTVTLTDINDKYPTFSETNYVTNVDETLAPGSHVINVSATDDDASPEFNDQNLVYGLTGCSELVVNSTSGEIALTDNAELDYEGKTALSCTLRVTDMGANSSDSLSTVSSLTVHVNDINDEIPVFENFVDSVNVVEGTEPGTPLVTVEASDPDTNASLSLALQFIGNPGQEIESWFILEEDNSTTASHYIGKIFIQNSPDRELSDEVLISVEVTDDNAEEGDQTTTKTLTVRIEDVNDVTPVFVGDYSRLNYDENTPEGTVVLNVQAEDPDIDDVLIYQLQDDFDYLQINPDNGSVSVLNEVDRETTATFQVILTVTDLVNHTQTVQMSVSINDLNDNSPVLDEDICSDSFTIVEDDYDGTFVTTVKATDIDEGAHAQIIFVLKNPNSVGYEYQYAPFDLDSNTGALTVNSSGDRINDREQFAEWQLIVDAFDQCDQVDPYCQVRSDECIMSVTVQDVNDNPPGNYKLSSGTEIITDEALVEGDLIEGLEISALDPDEPNSNNSRITFLANAMWSSGGSPTEVLFDADTNSRIGPGGVEEFFCTLSAARNLTGLRGSYVIEIKGMDSGSPQLFSSVNFSLTIEDANDMWPEFDYSFCLLESNLTITMVENITEVGVPLNCSSDDVVGRPADIYVTDEDAPQTPNSDVVLYIDYDDSTVIEGGVDNQLRAFAVYNYPDEGRFGIIITEKINREAGSKYSLSLVAQDNGDKPLVSYTSVMVVVKDFSEFAPTFCLVPPCSQTLWIKENTNKETNFQEAEDKDNSEEIRNDMIYYSIIDYDVDAFEILEPTVNQITSKIPLDRENKGSYSLIIMASNSNAGLPPDGVESTNQVLSVAVVIVDENDETPIYNDVIYGDFLDTGIKGDQVAILEFEDLDLNDTITYSFGSEFVWDNGQNYSEPFRIEVVDNRRSKIVLNMDPEGKTGYCSFVVDASDEALHTSSAPTEVFVVTKEYIVPFYFLNDIEDVQANQEEIEDILTNAFNFTCVIDSIYEAVDSNNVPINGQTVVSAHFIREVTVRQASRSIRRGIRSQKENNERKELQSPSGRPGAPDGFGQSMIPASLYGRYALDLNEEKAFGSKADNSNPRQTQLEPMNQVQGRNTVNGQEATVKYELVPEQEIEELGSSGTVASQLTAQFTIIGLNLIRIGDTPTDPNRNNQQTITNLKITLGTVTLFLGLCVVLLLLLYTVSTSKLKRQVKALSTSAFESKQTGEPEARTRQEHAPGSNLYSLEGTNPFFNVNEQIVDEATKDRQSISSWDSVLVGVEENPEFAGYLQKGADAAFKLEGEKWSNLADSPTVLQASAPYPSSVERTNPLLLRKQSESSSSELAYKESVESESLETQMRSQFTFK